MYPQTCTRLDDDWHDAHTGALFRPLLPRRTLPTLSPVSMPGGDWRTVVELPDASGRLHQLVVQSRAGTCSVGASRRPACLLCPGTITRLMVWRRRLLLLDADGIRGRITVDARGRPLNGEADPELEAELEPGTAPVMVRPLTLANRLRTATTVNATRAGWLRRQGPKDEIETLPSPLLLEGSPS